MSELKWNLGIFLETILFSFHYTVSMNLFDQLVIVTCDLDMKAKLSRKELMFGYQIFVVFK